MKSKKVLRTFSELSIKEKYQWAWSLIETLIVKHDIKPEEVDKFREFLLNFLINRSFDSEGNFV